MLERRYSEQKMGWVLEPIEARTLIWVIWRELRSRSAVFQQ